MQPGRTRGCENSSFRKGGCVGAGEVMEGGTSHHQQVLPPLRISPGPFRENSVLDQEPCPWPGGGGVSFPSHLPSPRPPPPPPPPPWSSAWGLLVSGLGSWVSLRGASEGRSGGRSLGVLVTHMACGWGQWAGPVRPSPTPPSLSCCHLGLLTCPQHVPSRTRPHADPLFPPGPRAWCGQSGAPQGLAQMARTGLQTGPSRTGHGHGQGRVDRAAARPSRRLRRDTLPGLWEPFPSSQAHLGQGGGQAGGGETGRGLSSRQLCCAPSRHTVSWVRCLRCGQRAGTGPGRVALAGTGASSLHIAGRKRWGGCLPKEQPSRPPWASACQLQPPLGSVLPCPAQPVWIPASLHPTSGHPLGGSPFCVDAPAPSLCPSPPPPGLWARGQPASSGPAMEGMRECLLDGSPPCPTPWSCVPAQTAAGSSCPVHRAVDSGS